MNPSLPKKTVALLGIGHTNAHIVKMWRMHPLPDTELVCISNFRKATYSGMLPGVLSGQYAPHEMEIDLVRLCAAVGAKLIVDDVCGLDPQRQEIHFEDRTPVRYDVLSIGIGSAPTFAGVTDEQQRALVIKPMQTFLPRLDRRLREAAATVGDRPLNIAIVGAGAGGTEIALCLPGRLKMVIPDTPYTISLIHAGDEILPGLLAGTAKRARGVLEERDAKIVLERRVREITSQDVELTDGRRIAADLVIWATSAEANRLGTLLGLEADERGFVVTDEYLRSISSPRIFAVGDSGTIRSRPTAKAGVFAVRQGPILWHNLKATLSNRPLRDYKPQRGFLKLLNTGDGRAIGEYLGWSFLGRFAWHWKDQIDRKFMAMYQDYTPQMMDDTVSTTPQMRCVGCGGKVSGSVLSAALRRLDVPTHDDVLIGLSQPDDAAVLKVRHGTVTVTTDFFQPPFEDAYLNGRLAALNAMSDVWAMGAAPSAALAMAVLPLGQPPAQEQLLYEMLAGAVRELAAAGATLAGGHTIEGPAAMIGFTILANQAGESPTTKTQLNVGDHLVLTKPLGTGILLAAHMQARCEAPWMKHLIRTMLQSNEASAKFARELGCTAMTDVTGFGFAAHLLEMLKASQVSADIRLDRIGLLDGVPTLAREGFESTMAAANRSAEQHINVREQLRQQPAYAALFDPQTCGGLLYALPASAYRANEEELNRRGHRCVGQVGAHDDSAAMLTLT